MNRKVKIFVLGSVLLNVLLAGAVIGHFSHRMGRSHEWRAQESALPEEKREQIHAALRQVWRESRPLREEMKDSREAALRLLAAEPFDEAAYQREVEKLNALRAQMTQQMADAVKGLAKQLTPEERKELAKILRRLPSHRKHSGGYPQ